MGQRAKTMDMVMELRWMQKLQLQTSKKFNFQVDTPTGSSTVYVHGFGTDDSYGHEGYPGGHQAYGYGHIDPYLNHKQGDTIFLYYS